MNDERHFVVIGGGVIGLSVALHLAQHRPGSVTLLEKRHLGAGSSGKSGAILRQHYSHAATIDMARFGLEFFTDLQQNQGHEIGLQQTGAVFLYPGSQRVVVEKNVALQRSRGVDSRLLDPEQLEAVAPGCQQMTGLLGVHEPEAAFVDPLLAMHALADRARAAGAQIEEARAVTRLLERGSRVTGVELDDGRVVPATTVVVCAGPWTARVCAPLGLELPLVVQRPQQAFFKPGTGWPTRGPMWLDLVTDFYVKREPTGLLRAGQMSYDGDEVVTDPDRADEHADSEFLRRMTARLRERLPGMERAICLAGGAGLYTLTPDHHALIGRLDERPGLYLCAGFSGHGFKLAPAVGEAVAAELMGRQPRFAIDRMRPDRFARGAAIESSTRYGILG